VIITVTVVMVVKPAIYYIIHMVSMGNHLMPTSVSMYMITIMGLVASIWVSIIYFYAMFVYMSLVVVV
jgi:hypothetical protein